MRFKAEVSNFGNFNRLVQSIDKLTKTCIIKFACEQIQFIVCGNIRVDSSDTGVGSSGVQVWAHALTESLFSTYIVESKANNEIHLEVYVDSLVRALKSAQGAPEVMIHLTKKNDIPVLDFTTRTQSKLGKSIVITQEIVVRVLSAAQVESIQEPMCPEPDVNILMPPLGNLRTIAERLRTMSDAIIVSANRNGEMTFRAECQKVRLETFWHNLEKPDIDASQVPSKSQERDPQELASARVDAKSLTRFLASNQNSNSAILSICHNHALVIYVYLGGDDRLGILTFYIPVKSDGWQ